MRGKHKGAKAQEHQPLRKLVPAEDMGQIEMLLVHGGQGQGMRRGYGELAGQYVTAAKLAVFGVPLAWIIQLQGDVTPLPRWLNTTLVAHPQGWIALLVVLVAMASLSSAMVRWGMSASMDATPNAAVEALQEARNTTWGLMAAIAAVPGVTQLVPADALLPWCAGIVLLPWAIWRWQ